MFNLLTNQWMQALTVDGNLLWISPAEITHPEIVNIVAPRPDFRGALYQFLIGLLQTTIMPIDREEWLERYDHPPSAEELNQLWHPLIPAFNLYGDGPAFLQDYDAALLNRQSPELIQQLLIDMPGENTLKDNKDLFIKRDSVSVMCPKCACLALLTLQLNAPSGGQGHRTSLRGGGPLTTLVIPNVKNKLPTLWQQLWLNILAKDYQKTNHSNITASCAEVFPWLAPTRTSEKGSKTEKTEPTNVNPLQAYWGMPRRIRLNFTDTVSGQCHVCGETHEQLLQYYHAKNYGINYGETWRHPLTPYRENPDGSCSTIKGKEGGFTYRDWLGIALMSNQDKKTRYPADVVKYCQSLKPRESKLAKNQSLGLWCFGYDMDNMKARCWYEQRWPVFALEPNQQKILQEKIRNLIIAIESSLKWLHEACKNALGAKKIHLEWLRQELYANTTEDFYEFLEKYKDYAMQENLIDDLLVKWWRLLRSQSIQLFDQYVSVEQLINKGQSAIFKERSKLEKILNKQVAICMLVKEN